MNTNNPNLNDYFNSAKSQPAVVSGDEARTLVNDISEGRVSPYKSNFRTKKGFRKMNFILAGLATTAAIGVISMNVFNSGNQAEKINQVQNTTQNVNQPNSNLAILTGNETITEKKSEPKSESVINDVKKKESEIKPFEPKKMDIKGVNLVELTGEEAEKLGIHAVTGDNAYIEFWDSRFKPTLCSLFVKGNFTFTPKENENGKSMKTVFPRMITDNVGNRRFSVINDEDSKLIQADNATLNMNDFNPNKKRIQKKMMFMGNSMCMSDSSQNKPDFTKIIKMKSLIPDSLMKILKSGNINTDSLIRLAMMNIQFKAKDNSHGNIKFDSLNGGNFELFVNNPPDVIVDDSEMHLSLGEGGKVELGENESENNEEMEFEIQMQNIDTDMEKLGSDLDSVSHNISLSIDTDSLKKSVHKTVRKRISSSSIIKDSVLTICKPMILMMDCNKLDDSLEANSKNKVFTHAFDLSSKINKLNEEMDKYIRINKMIPIVIPMGKNPNKNEYNQSEDFSFILWFDPTPELLEILPESVKARIEPELKALSESPEICNTAIKGEEAYLDIWRACSGAVENLHTFPNPAKDKINLKYSLTANRLVTISINDLFGRKIYEMATNVSKQAGSYEEQFALKNINPGMYLISIKTDKNEQAVQRVIVE